jgi:hypothetical protein
VARQFHFLMQSVLEFFFIAALTLELFRPTWHFILKMFLEWLGYSGPGWVILTSWYDSTFVKKLASFELAFIVVVHLPCILMDSERRWKGQLAKLFTVLVHVVFKALSYLNLKVIVLVFRWTLVFVFAKARHQASLIKGNFFLLLVVILICLIVQNSI